MDITVTFANKLSELKDGYMKRPSGRAFTNSYSDLVDEVIRGLIHEASEEPWIELDPGSRDIAVVALGGYGRRELCPHSDIDLMILHRLKDKAVVTAISEKLFYPLWDLGLQVGHGTRTVRESLGMAASNFELQTSFLEARVILGNRGLLDELQTGLLRQLRARRGRRFLQSIIGENAGRHAQYGQAAYLLEPDLKEGEGGLRDIHAMLWAAKGLLGCTTFHELASGGYTTQFDADALEEAHEFLLKIRNMLHYISGRNNDRLFFEHQVEVSRALKYKAENGLGATERFMRSFYTQASAVELIQRSFWEQIKADYLPPRRAGAQRGAAARGGVALAEGKLSLTGPAAVDSHPGSEVRLFARSVTDGIPIDHRKLEAVREGLAAAAPAAWTAGVRDDFFAVLSAGEKAVPALEVMDYLGVLARYIPEWAGVRCLPQYDSYHLYTVDMHLFLTVAELRRIATGAYDETSPLLKQVYGEVKQEKLLLLAGLLHDIGKGRGKGHSEKGAAMVRTIAERMGLPARDCGTIEFLVANHLLLADTAQRRDLNDEDVIIEVAETMVHEERLKMLYLLSVADSIATGPKAWDTWKDTLLSELFLKVLHIIQGGEYTSRKSIDRLRKTASSVKELLAGRYAGVEVDLFLHQMPHSYLLSQKPEDIVAHFEQMRSADGVSVRVKRGSGITELILVAPDKPGLFCKVCGVLALHGINILGAQAYTRSDGTALDLFKIAGYFEQRVSDDTGKIQADLTRALEGKIALEYRVTEKARRYSKDKKALSRPPKVTVDNASSDFYTVIEVHASDRIGLLYTVTRAMFELDLDIHLAKVSTNVDQVVDVFYVWDAYGQKLSDDEQIEDVKRAIVKALE